MTPSDRKYAKSHEWIKIEGGVAIVGISDHAQDSLGDITYVELPEVGASVDAEGEAGVVESVKAASDIYSPIGGEISEVNEALEDEPEVINSDPYNAGWIFKLKNFDESQMDSLFDSDGYDKFLETEE